MLTIYTYKGRPRDLSAFYIPCLIGTEPSGDVQSEVYFESVGVLATTANIRKVTASRWVAHPTRIMTIQFEDNGVKVNAYALADELLTHLSDQDDV